MHDREYDTSSEPSVTVTGGLQLLTGSSQNRRRLLYADRYFHVLTKAVGMSE